LWNALLSPARGLIPKTHVAGLADLDEGTGAHMFKVEMRIADGVKRSGVKCEGVNLLLSRALHPQLIT